MTWFPGLGSVLVLANLHSCWASSLDLELSFRISSSGWALGSTKRIPGLCLSNCPLSSAFHLPIAPVLLCLPHRNQAQMWSEWQLDLPSLAHLANPHYQPSLPDRTCIVLEEGVGPGTKSVSGPQSKCKVSAPFCSQTSTQVVSFTLILWNMSCVSFHSFLRNKFLFFAFAFNFPHFSRILVSISSFSLEIFVLNYRPWRERRDRNASNAYA